MNLIANDDVEGQTGHEDTVQAYIDVLVAVFREVRRVLKPRGTLFLNLGDTYYSGNGQPKGGDPKQIWRQGVPPFQESGSPSGRLEDYVLANGGTAATFGFSWRGDVLHLNSATSQQLLRMGKDRNPYAKWIDGLKGREGSPEYDFEAVAGAAESYSRFLETYRAQAEALHPEPFADLLDRMKSRARS